MPVKYSDQIADWLVELGYTQCFFVSGGNIMHLIESLSRKVRCCAVIHEVAAGIAAEYFNESNATARALALVTAGPGLTNMVTAFAGAFLESRELLVLGGQVKTADLARGGVRQRGIQEINGVSIVKSVCIRAELVDRVIDGAAFSSLVEAGRGRRNGPVFLEIPLDIQARSVDPESLAGVSRDRLVAPSVSDTVVSQMARRFNTASRPSVLIGGGITRATARELQAPLANLGIPLMTTWNATDRIPADQWNYMGRPNTWGQRSSNLIIQQSDFVLALGTRLGLQQTGFNWQQFVPHGDVAQVDIDPAELAKGHPRVHYPIAGDANDFLKRIIGAGLQKRPEWVAYAREIREALPVIEPSNKTAEGYLSPFVFASELSDLCACDDVIIPCSSGGAFTTMMQAFRQKIGQTIITNKGLASMGYGLSGAIGAAFANPLKRVVLVEGDGGFSQNLQEIGTAGLNRLNIKIFVFDDSGYASIRMTQRNYFGGRYVGCDIATGLGLPNWDRLFSAWDVPSVRISNGFVDDPTFHDLFAATGTAAFIVSIDPQQTYLPKITSRMTAGGAMESNPLHLMTPDLSDDEKARYLKFI